jgi:hypothetical protein
VNCPRSLDSGAAPSGLGLRRRRRPLPAGLASCVASYARRYLRRHDIDAEASGERLISSCTLGATIERPYEETVDAVRSALETQGFDVLTEIDLRATLKEKLDLDVAPQVILGAGRPQLAYEALQVDPSIARWSSTSRTVRRVVGCGLPPSWDPSRQAGLVEKILEVVRMRFASTICDEAARVECDRHFPSSAPDLGLRSARSLWRAP